MPNHFDITGKTMFRRALALVCVLGLASCIANHAILAADAQPTTQPVAAADDISITSGDGLLTLTLPREWKKGSIERADIVIVAHTELSREQLTVSAENKVDIVNLEAYAALSQKTVAAAFKNVESTKPVTLQVNGHKAIRYDTTFDDGSVRWGCVTIYFETATRCVAFTVTGRRTKFEAMKDDWAKLADRLTENPK